MPRWAEFVATVVPIVVTPGASLTLLAQRVTAHGDPAGSLRTQLVELTAAHAALSTCWLLLRTALLGPATSLVGSRTWRPWIARASALVLVVMGARWLVG